MEPWNRRNDEACMTERNKGREDQSSEGQLSGAANPLKQRNRQVLFSLQTLISKNKQLVFVFFRLCFCFVFVPQKGLEKYSDSGETFLSAGKTKPRLTTLAVLPSVAPNHRPSTLSCFEKSQPKPKLLKSTLPSGT